MYICFMVNIGNMGISISKERKKTGKTHYHAKLGHPDNGRAIKELFV